MTDRRRINAPSGGTNAPVFVNPATPADSLASQRPTRTRAPDELRKIFLKTGLVPLASGSAYLELSPPSAPPTKTLTPSRTSLKLTCAVHGPKPLPRSAPFSPHLILSTTVKFAPFATRARRGYIRDSTERDLGVHLETALRGVVIGERWPKSGVEVIVTVIEGEEDGWWGDGLVGGSSGAGGGGWGLMSVLAGTITVASAAIADAGIDCVDLVSGGVAAVVRDVDAKGKGKTEEGLQEGESLVLDPCPAEHKDMVAACVVGYLAGRDEITEIWMKGETGGAADVLLDKAVHAAVASVTVVKEAVKESIEQKYKDVLSSGQGGFRGPNITKEVEMTG
ncbi:uncharacterized protein BDZ99DRAFT_131633 [Mytilinidion resinicola]|uniref:Exoribonuclease phosphorolytic domain-containing protein n=1 Tax=Mytilinidion resinicola TaxID=574789 RepID=A0A6A6Z693_9PEZI|nr:uncharacterized protein BDZ99DRAFT_131633 [Mytilinidion resinicola]KAF2816229.1 hypothetical protein BDZ99DRAFT_131633 [Mytilinidion resinicola]